MSNLVDAGTATEESASLPIGGFASKEGARQDLERPLPWLGYFALETRAATFVYWSALLLVAATVFVSALLPCVDYPQHLALGDLARRLAVAGAPEHARFQLNYFTYNGLFQLLVAKLSGVVSTELAGRVVVAGSLLALGGAVIALVRVLRRPPVYAALFVPAVFSFAVGWGFVNYALGTAIAISALVFVARALLRPTFTDLAAVAVLGWLCAFTHVLAMLLLCLMAAAMAPELAWRSTRGAMTRAGHGARAIARMAVSLAPLLVGCAWCIAVYREQYDWDPPMYRDATLEGSAPPIWQKLVYFGAWATGLHSDHTDQVLLWIALAALAGAMLVGWRRRGAKEKVRPTSTEPHDQEHMDGPLWLPLIVSGAAYLGTPMVLIGTHLIFPRLTQAVLLAGVLAAPRLVGSSMRRLSTLALAVAACTGVNLAAHAVGYARETADASRVIDEAPAGRRATAIVYDGETFTFRNGTLTHLAAYYAVRRGGDWAFSFARFLSVPVRFLPGGSPSWPMYGWEFSPSSYNPRCKYARAFDLVFVKSPSDFERARDEEDRVRRLVFGVDARAVKLVSHHGAFWAFDTAMLPGDGTY